MSGADQSISLYHQNKTQWISRRIYNAFVLTNSIQQLKILPAAQVGVMRVQDMTMRRMQIAAAMECTTLIVSITLASTVLFLCFGMQIA